MLTPFGARRSRTALKNALAVALAMTAQSSGFAQDKSWDKAAHVREVASMLARDVRTKGAIEVRKSVDVCYQREAAAKSFTKSVAECVIKDMILSYASAGIYGMRSKERAGEVLQAMAYRVTSAFASRSVPPAEAKSFTELVKKEGLVGYAKPAP